MRSLFVIPGLALLVTLFILPVAERLHDDLPLSWRDEYAIHLVVDKSELMVLKPIREKHSLKGLSEPEINSRVYECTSKILATLIHEHRLDNAIKTVIEFGDSVEYQLFSTILNSIDGQFFSGTNVFLRKGTEKFKWWHAVRCPAMRPQNYRPQKTIGLTVYVGINNKMCVTFFDTNEVVAEEICKYGSNSDDLVKFDEFISQYGDNADTVKTHLEDNPELFANDSIYGNGKWNRSMNIIAADSEIPSIYFPAIQKIAHDYQLTRNNRKNRRTLNLVTPREERFHFP